jgi:hypothetical protein
MNKVAKFEEFLESLKGHDQDSLIESVKEGFRALVENELEQVRDSKEGELEHVIGNYYYDSKAGKYYDKSTDFYVKPNVVQRQLDAVSNRVKVNNEVAGKLLKLGTINGNQYQQLIGKRDWPDEIAAKLFKEKGISLFDLYKETKSEMNILEGIESSKLPIGEYLQKEGGYRFKKDYYDIRKEPSLQVLIKDIKDNFLWINIKEEQLVK